MSRSCDPQKLGVWRGRLERFSRSGLPVERFCARERVSVASFYYWRQKLRPGPLATAEGRRKRGLHRSASRRAGVFQPVRVVPALSGVCIHLPGGTRIEVRAEQVEAVRAVVGEVVRLGRGAHAARVDGNPQTR